jgi:hypothetical protein
MVKSTSIRDDSLNIATYTYRHKTTQHALRGGKTHKLPSKRPTYTTHTHTYTQDLTYTPTLYSFPSLDLPPTSPRTLHTQTKIFATSHYNITRSKVTTLRPTYLKARKPSLAYHPSKQFASYNASKYNSFIYNQAHIFHSYVTLHTSPHKRST